MLNVYMRNIYILARGFSAQRRQAAWLLFVFLVCPLLAAEAQQPEATSPTEVERQKRKILGTVIEQRKYSLRIASGEENVEVAVPDKTPIDQRLDKPRIDLASNVVLQELLGSQEPGSAIPIEIQDTLPEQMGIVVDFAHINERRRVMSENPKKLIRYRLLPLDQLPSDPENELLLTAKVTQVDERGQLTLQTEREEIIAELGNRDGRLGARTIADLRPLESEVEIQADLIEGKWVAQNIVYRRIKLFGSPTGSNLRRMLVLGDEVSLSYLHNLRKEFAGKYLIHHPPENCRGTVNWERLPMWLGPYRQPGYQWDVVIFNLGLGDLNTETAAYRAALKSILPQLQATKAKLIWLSTTPLPNGWEANAVSTGKKLSHSEAQAKIKELNAAAAEEFRLASDVQIVDLSSAIESELETRFATWSAGRSPMFNREQSEMLAKQIGQLLGTPPTKNEDE